MQSIMFLQSEECFLWSILKASWPLAWVGVWREMGTEDTQIVETAAYIAGGRGDRTLLKIFVSNLSHCIYFLASIFQSGFPDSRPTKTFLYILLIPPRSKLSEWFLNQGHIMNVISILALFDLLGTKNFSIYSILLGKEKKAITGEGPG